MYFFGQIFVKDYIILNAILQRKKNQVQDQLKLFTQQIQLNKSIYFITAIQQYNPDNVPLKCTKIHTVYICFVLSLCRVVKTWSTADSTQLSGLKRWMFGLTVLAL